MEIKLINSESVIAELIIGNETQTIEYAHLKEIAPQFDRDDVEGIWLDNSEKIVLGIIFIAQGQGSIIIAWDTEQGKLVHVSNGSYSEVLLLDGEYIYSLCDVSCWGVRSHLEMHKYKFGTIDMFCEGEELEINDISKEENSDNNMGYWIEKIGNTIKGGHKDACCVHII